MVANSSPSELSLECKPQSFSMLLKSFASDHLQAHKLEEYLSLLEEERLKIEAFKRELPLCMQLLTNAMEVSRQELQSYKAKSTNQEQRPILEEFIPIKHTSSDAANSDKSNWMVSAQLWSQANEGASTKLSESSEMEVNPKPSLLDITNESNNKERNASSGAFLQLTKEMNSNSMSHDLGLAMNEKEAQEMRCLKNENEFQYENAMNVSNRNGMDETDQRNVAGVTNTSSQTNRKQRRCWSPELHRRFVNALQMLGGSQVATPKQIRELMKVDGLTNDEVKSHLQKYRLHTRRPGPSPQQAGTPGPQLVVLGGIWVPPEYATSAAHHHHHMVQQSTIYNAHPTAQVGPHYSAIPQTEFYPPPPHHHHPNLHLYKAPPQQRQRSNPEPDGARDRSESIEDDKSGSISWKGDSGEESNEEMKRRRLLSSSS